VAKTTSVGAGQVSVVQERLVTILIKHLQMTKYQPLLSQRPPSEQICQIAQANLRNNGLC
jgi:hypothetical protein